jgi:hypothetical protein
MPVKAEQFGMNGCGLAELERVQTGDMDWVTYWLTVAAPNNGCPLPKSLLNERVQQWKWSAEDAAWSLSQELLRQNFWWGLMIRLTARQEEKYLYKALRTSGEFVPADADYDRGSVPPGYAGGIVTGLAQPRVKEMVGRIVEYIQNPEDDQARRIDQALEVVSRAAEELRTLAGFHNRIMRELAIDQENLLETDTGAGA